MFCPSLDCIIAHIYPLCALVHIGEPHKSCLNLCAGCLRTAQRFRNEWGMRHGLNLCAHARRCRTCIDAMPLGSPVLPQLTHDRHHVLPHMLPHQVIVRHLMLPHQDIKRHSMLPLTSPLGASRCRTCTSSGEFRCRISRRTCLVSGMRRLPDTH